MENKTIIKTIKATCRDILITLFITALFFAGIYIIAGKQINEGLSVLKIISVNSGEKKEEEVTINETKKRLETYPEYGTQYATIQIPSIDVDLPVYYGETPEILKKGVGQSGGSYFPGEGGSVIYMGHNAANTFRRFSELKKGQRITVKTSYGDFTYEIYDMQIIKETDMDKLPIQREKEILMVYTCYPFVNIGYTTQRYVVYAELVEE